MRSTIASDRELSKVFRPLTKARRRSAPGVEPLENRTFLSVTLVSANALGQAGGAAVAANDAEISSDGRFVAYSTDQTDVVAGVTDTNNREDVYVRDITGAGPSVLVSGNNNTAFGGRQPSVSADGRYVAFTTTASLSASDQNLSGEDVYVWDRLNPTVFTLVTGRASDGVANTGFLPSISNNGRVVAFVSTAAADTFQAGTTDTNAARDVFVRNLDTNATVLASAVPGGLVAGNGASTDPEVSGDGTAVAFSSVATDLTVVPVTGTQDEAYRRVFAAPNVDLVSVATPGGVAAGGGSTSTISISDDGNLVAFSSGSTDVVANDTNGAVRDVFVRNMSAGQTNVVSTNAAGARSSGNASGAAISGNGQFVAFNSSANNLVAGDTGSPTDIFLKNTADGSITRLSQDDAGTGGNAGSSFPSVNLDGSAVAFVSQATNLVANTEQAAEADDDVFAWRSGAVTPTDTTPPTAAITAANVTAAGGTTQTVTVVYSDNTAVNVATIGADDITVAGPGGAPVTVTGVQATPATNASPVTAVYMLAAPGGTFDAADDGAYTITLPAGAVTDAAGNPVAAGTGTFSVAVGGPSGPGPDLVVAAITGGKKGLPPSVVGGAKGQVRVRVTNQGDAPVAGPVSIALVARDVDPATPETGDTAIVTTPAKVLKLKPGKSKLVPVKFTYPNVASGAAYALVATVDAANGVTEGNETNNEGASATNVTIAPAFVDLAATAIGQPKGGTIAIGKKNAITLTVQNLGNVPATGLLNMDFYASTTPDGVIDTGDILLGSIPKKLKLKAGASKTIKVAGGVVDPSFPPGTYYITAVINNPPAITETSAANNTVVSTTSFPAA